MCVGRFHARRCGWLNVQTFPQRFLFAPNKKEFVRFVWALFPRGKLPLGKKPACNVAHIHVRAFLQIYAYRSAACGNGNVTSAVRNGKIRSAPFPLSVGILAQTHFFGAFAKAIQANFAQNGICPKRLHCVLLAKGSAVIFRHFANVNLRFL